MAFPFAGMSIAAISLIPALIASADKKKLNKLKQYQKFPSHSKPNNSGYYWLRGSLQSNDSIKIDINTGSFVVEQNFGIMRYQIDRCIESRHIIKETVEAQVDVDVEVEVEGGQIEGGAPGVAPKKKKKKEKKYITKEEKRYKWVKSFESAHQYPVKYASILEVNGININDFKDLFVLDKKYELFTASPYLNDKGSVNNNQNIFNLNLNLNLNASNNGDDVIGEQERKTIGYQHKWYGVNIGDIYTIIGYWNGNAFVRGNNINMVSKSPYHDIINDYENVVWWTHALSVAGFLIAGGVGIYETKLLSKL